MIRITQSDYIDFISKSGLPKLTKVRALFNRPEYHPSLDFYRRLREEFVNHIKQRKNKSELFKFLADQNSKKQSRFELLINGYLRFLGKKAVEGFEPPISYWSYKDLSIKMNPDIGLLLNEEKFIIKLYFKDTPLSKGQIDILLWMMNSTLCSGIYSGYKCALLDVERSKLHYKISEQPINALIEGEAESFIKMWHSLEKSA